MMASSRFLAAGLAAVWAGVLSVAAGPAAAQSAITYVQLKCEGVPYSETITSGGAPTSSACAKSGDIALGANVFGTFSTAGSGSAGITGGSWGVSVDYQHVVPAGTGVGPTSYVELGAIDYLTVLALPGPVGGPAPLFGLGGIISRSFGGSADLGMAFGTEFSFNMSLTNRSTGAFDICELYDSGFCSVAVPIHLGDSVSFSWGGFSLASVSGSGFPGFGSAFDPGGFLLNRSSLVDDQGRPILGARVSAASGTDYLAITPVPEPEIWALLFMGLSGLGARGWMGRRTGHRCAFTSGT